MGGQKENRTRHNLTREQSKKRSTKKRQGVEMLKGWIRSQNGAAGRTPGGRRGGKPTHRGGERTGASSQRGF